MQPGYRIKQNGKIICWIGPKMENNTLTSWTVTPERSVGHPVSGFLLSVLEKVLYAEQ